MKTPFCEVYVARGFCRLKPLETRPNVCLTIITNHLVLMRLWQQRAEQDGAMMDVQDRENLILDTPLQPRVGEMAPIGMHVIPHQRGVLESGGNYIGTAIGVQHMATEPSTFFRQRMANRPLPRENDE